MRRLRWSALLDVPARRRLLELRFPEKPSANNRVSDLQLLLQKVVFLHKH